jgi:Ca2+-binding EF-hand superfamily protein
LSALLGEYFRLLDANHDGRLELKEYAFVTKVIDPQALFQSLDTDQDQQLTEKEFLGGGRDAKVGRRDFRLFDLNGDGKLSQGEFLLSPEYVPLEQRGSLPDPVTARVEQRFQEIQKQWKGWDRNADGQLAQDEFTASGLSRAVPGLAAVRWEDWDLDHSGGVSLEDCRQVLEIGYGVIRVDGQALRNARGQVVHGFAFQMLDRDHDGRVSRDEYQKSKFDGELAEARFAEADANQDGSISFREWSEVPYRWTDPLKDFRWMDRDLDGRLDASELQAGAPAWLQSVAKSLFSGFDQDADGFLSLSEYQFTPLVNQLAGWNELRYDRNNDGRLGPEEFQWETGLALSALLGEYFRLLDANHDGRLELKELAFNFDRSKIPRRILFENWDANHDQALALDEILTDLRQVPHAKDDLNFEVRLAGVEAEFARADVDQDLRLTPQEFASEAGAGLFAPRAARPVRSVKAPTANSAKGRLFLGEPPRFWALLGINVLIVGGAAAFVLRRK